MMIGLRQGILCPFYATALLLVVNQFRASHRLNFSRLWQIMIVRSFGMGCQS